MPRRSKRRLQALRVYRPRVGIVQMALVGEQHDTEGENREAEAGPGVTSVKLVWNCGVMERPIDTFALVEKPTHLA